MGEKQVLLYAPECRDRLYPHQDFTRKNSSRVDPENIDNSSFPLAADLPFFCAEVAPGDALYIPKVRYIMCSPELLPSALQFDRIDRRALPARFFKTLFREAGTWFLSSSCRRRRVEILCSVLFFVILLSTAMATHSRHAYVPTHFVFSSVAGLVASCPCNVLQHFGKLLLAVTRVALEPGMLRGWGH